MEEQQKSQQSTSVIAKDSKRIWSAIVMIVCLIIVFWINNPKLIWALMGVLYLIAMHESTKLYKISFNIFMLILSIVLWCGLLVSNNPLIVALLILCVACFYAIKNNTELGYKNIAPFIYPTLPFVCIYVVYKNSLWHLIWLIMIVAIADIFAYYGGKRFGKTKLCEVSPKKTMEGALIGVFAGVVIGSITGIGIFGQKMSYAIIASIVIVVFSILGDLFESALKRTAEIKDSGSILPGHGGILDRIDAVMFGSVAMLFILSLLKMYEPINSAIKAIM